MSRPSKQLIAERQSLLLNTDIELYENTQQQVRIFNLLSTLSQLSNSNLSIDSMLHAQAGQIAQLLEADLCLVLLLNEHQTELRLSATSHFQEELMREVQPVILDYQTWECLHELHTQYQFQIGNMHSLSRLNPLKHTEYATILSIPLVSNAQYLGLINCYWNKPFHYTTELQQILSIIANQVALAIKCNQLTDNLTQQNIVKDFFYDLTEKGLLAEDSLRRRAHLLGGDLSKPYTCVAIECSFADITGKQEAAVQEQIALHKHIVEQVKLRLQENYPFSLCYEQEYVLSCLVCCNSELENQKSLLTACLGELHQQFQRQFHACLTFGISNTCSEIKDYPQCWKEAKEALNIGRMSKENNGVAYFSELGVKRYLYQIARLDLPKDIYQEKVDQIAAYDRHKGTEYLTTLEVFLDSAGNLARTANQLNIHRNTIIQRIERLQSHFQIDLDHQENWFALQFALKIHKMQAAEGSR